MRQRRLIVAVLAVLLGGSILWIWFGLLVGAADDRNPEFGGAVVEQLFLDRFQLSPGEQEWDVVLPPR